MIQYRRANSKEIRVYLDNETVGNIIKVVGGYQYYPKGKQAKDAGEVYLTVGQVKQSLEEDEE